MIIRKKNGTLPGFIVMLNTYISQSMQYSRSFNLNDDRIKYFSLSDIGAAQSDMDPYALYLRKSILRLNLANIA